MADDMDLPPRAHDDEPRREARPKRRRWGLILLGILVGIPLLVFGLWSLITLSYTYSSGDRAGYQLKLSRKGWLCKTWEGEIAMTAIPGSAPQTFAYTVRDDAVAHRIEQLAGQPVSLQYEQHRFLPTSCFGDTEYFVTGVTPLAGQIGPSVSPGFPAQVPQQAPSTTPTPVPVPTPATPAAPPAPAARTP